MIDSVSASTHQYIDTDVNILTGTYQANESIAEYYVKAIDGTWAQSAASDTIKYERVEGEAQEKIAVKFNSEIYDYSLDQNYRIAFNPTTQIKYSLKEDGIVTIKLFDILGNEVSTFVNEPKSKGIHFVDFNAGNLTSGVYIYRMSIKGFVKTMKLIVLK